MLTAACVRPGMMGGVADALSFSHWSTAAAGGYPQ